LTSGEAVGVIVAPWAAPAFGLIAVRCARQIAMP
jgi:hypothetical protein